MPIVVMKEGVKESSLNRRRQHDFPTPESPISKSLICGIQVSCCNTDICSRTAYQEIIITRPSHIEVDRAAIGEKGKLSEVVECEIELGVVGYDAGQGCSGARK
jgi:hypothetical protein